MGLTNGASHMTFLGAIDQGTTSTRFLIFDQYGQVVARHHIEVTQIYPRPGWQEHDPEELLSSVGTCIDRAVDDFEVQGHSRGQIRAVGITNQRETTVVWDRTTGQALYNAIVWSDTRSQDIVRRLKRRIGASELHGRCGIPLSTYPAASKLLWLLEHVPEVKDAYDRGVLAFGTVDTWLTYRLNGGTSRDIYVTDPSNASRTMFMNLDTLQYDEDLLDWFRIDPAHVLLPKIVKSSDPEAFGSLQSTALEGTRITGCLGDQSAALVGQKAFTAGSAKNTYGTGCFMLFNVGSKPVISTHGLMTTVAFDFGDKGTMYALEGSIAAAGSSVSFLVDNFGFIESPAKLTALAETVDDNGGCTFVTAFSGLFAPYWVDSARGTIFGITAFTQRGHIARATIEAVCFQTKAILDAMEKDSGYTLTELAVDGGMSNSDLVMQTQSDIINMPVKRPSMHEATALGAAVAAGLAVGVWGGLQDLADVNMAGQTVFRPEISVDEAGARYSHWQRAVEMCKGWVSSSK